MGQAECLNMDKTYNSFTALRGQGDHNFFFFQFVAMGD